MEIVDSTSDYAKRYATNNIVTQDTLILSDTQTHGRGRLNGRLWESPIGNFYGTFIFSSSEFSCTIDPRTIILHSIKNFLSEINASVSVKVLASIKQPNDIVISDKKLSGVLIEKDCNNTFAGIGINLVSSPLETSTNILHEYGIALRNIDVGHSLHKKIRYELAKAKP